VWDGSLGWVTHYFLLELYKKIMGDETKEMSGGEGWVGVRGSGGLYRFGRDMATL